MEILLSIVVICALIALLMSRRRIDTAVGNWTEKQKVELKKREDCLLEKYIESGLVTEEEVEEWEKLGINAFEKASEKQQQRLKSKFEELDEMFAGKKNR